MWGHPSFTGGLEPPLVGARSGDEQVARGTASSNVYQFVGDYTNPILKPQAAEVVKKHGEISLTGVTYPTPGNQCWPEGVPYIFGISECRCSRSRTRSPSSMPAIMKSATCA